MSDPRAIIREAAARYGIPESVFLRFAQIESNLNPSAINPSSRAAGLFQFVPSTARQYGLSNPLDPAANADAAARLYRTNQTGLQRSLGRAPTPGEVYLAHQQGLGGASALLSNPEANAVDVLRRFYSAQRARAAVVQNGGTPEMTAGQFASRWTSRFDGQPSAPAPGGAPEAAPTVAAAPLPSDPPPVAALPVGVIAEAPLPSFSAPPQPQPVVVQPRRRRVAVVSELSNV